MSGTYNHLLGHNNLLFVVKLNHQILSGVVGKLLLEIESNFYSFFYSQVSHNLLLFRFVVFRLQRNDRLLALVVISFLLSRHYGRDFFANGKALFLSHLDVIIIWI